MTRDRFLKELERSRKRRAKGARRVYAGDPVEVPPPSAFPSRKEYDAAYYQAHRAQKLAAANQRWRTLREAARG